MGSLHTTNEFDPRYEETFENSHAYYEEMRQKCPVAHSEAFGGFWAVFKYEDVIRMQTETETFSTAEKNVVPPATRNRGRRPPLHYDPPEHEKYRAPTRPVFSNSRMLALRPELTVYARELFEPLAAAGKFDFTVDFAEHFAARAFGLILKLPAEMLKRARHAQVQYYRAQMEMDR